MMKQFLNCIAALGLVLWGVLARAQEQAENLVVEPTVSPIWTVVFVAMVLGLIVWFVIAMLRAESKRKAEQRESA
jgi:hypothetical protein